MQAPEQLTVPQLPHELPWFATHEDVAVAVTSLSIVPKVALLVQSDADHNLKRYVCPGCMPE